MPELTLESLAERVAALEAQIAEIKASGRHIKDWRNTIGMFSGDETMRAIFDAAMEIREAERRAVRE